MTTWDIRQGDCRELLRAMPAESVHCAITSPPYWSLRDYKTPPLVWGGDEGCEHEWGEEPVVKSTPHTGLKAAAEKATGRTHGERNKGDDGDYAFTASQGAFCGKCGSWRGSLGLEPTPELYIEHMVEVFREVKRVMRKDATCWVNMGDSYASGHADCSYLPPDSPKRPKTRKPGARGGMKPRGHAGTAPTRSHSGIGQYANTTGFNAQPVGLKPKDLCGMPWRLAFALQADGWWLRSEIIWHKPNPMPESVRDRPTKSHETVFLLTKSARYYYDADAIREPTNTTPQTHNGEPRTERTPYNIKAKHESHAPSKGCGFLGLPSAGRNRRTVWTIPTAAFPGAHFATFAPKLIEPMILTSPTKVCAVCGRGWKRMTERHNTPDGNRPHGVHYESDRGESYKLDKQLTHVTTLGFRPACDCGSEETKPATVLDIFCGSGTTPMVALRHNRNAIGLELSEEYARMARERISGDCPMFNGRLP